MATDVVWLAGRVEDEGWHVLGVFRTQEAAFAVTKDSRDFVGPLVMDEYLGHEVVEWENAYYPYGRSKTHIEKEDHE